MTIKPTGKIYYLTNDELNRFFSVIPKKDLLAIALFTFMYRFGLRASEAIALKESNFGSDGRVYIERLKNGNNNYYKVSDEDLTLIKKYIASKKEKTDYIFGRIGNKKIARSTVFRLYRKYAIKAGLDRDKRHPHCLRHSIAVHMLDEGINVEDVQDRLGHKSIVNTMEYAKISDKKRSMTDEKVNKFKIS